MAYAVEISKATARELRRLPRQDVATIRAHILALGLEPRPAGVRKIADRERSYRIRVGAFRVIFDIFDDKQTVVISHVLRRTETTYRRL